MNTQFSMSLHILVVVATSETPPTSFEIASSVGTNPVVIRRLSTRLKQAGLVTVNRGPGGMVLAAPPADLSLAAVWSAIYGDRPIAPVHRGAPSDEVAARALPAIRRQITAADVAMERHLSSVSLADLVADRRGA